MNQPDPTKYHVHVYREMRLYFSGITAASAEAAAQLAAKKPTYDADYVEDCDGTNIAALVDIEGDTEYTQSRVIDFQSARVIDGAPRLLDALLDIKRLAEKSGDHEADPFSLLDMIASEARAALAIGASDPRYTIGSSHGELIVDAAGYVAECRADNDDVDGGMHLKSITRFDLEEWREHRGQSPDRRD